MQIIHEHIIVKVPTIFLDETKYKGVDGAKIMIDVLVNPEHHVRDFGEVVSVPFSLPKVPVAQDHVGLPRHHNESTYRFKTADDIERDIRIGDRVYFHRNCLLPDAGKSKFNYFYLYSTLEPENGHPDGKKIPYHYFRVKYELVYASVRYTPINAGYQKWGWWMESDLQKFDSTLLADNDLPQPGGLETVSYYLHRETGAVYRKDITMVGSWCLVEPDMETWDDISIPTPETINGKPIVDKFGKKQMKPKEQWIVAKAAPGQLYLRGWIKYIGNPLKGDNLELKPGAYVLFRPMTNTILKFEGVDYFRMIQRNILMWNPVQSRELVSL